MLETGKLVLVHIFLIMSIGKCVGGVSLVVEYQICPVSGNWPESSLSISLYHGPLGLPLISDCCDDSWWGRVSSGSSPNTVSLHIVAFLFAVEPVNHWDYIVLYREVVLS